MQVPQPKYPTSVFKKPSWIKFINIFPCKILLVLSQMLHPRTNSSGYIYSSLAVLISDCGSVWKRPYWNIWCWYSGSETTTFGIVGRVCDLVKSQVQGSLLHKNGLLQGVCWNYTFKLDRSRPWFTRSGCLVSKPALFWRFCVDLQAI